MKIAILGYEREGKSLLKFLKSLPADRRVAKYRGAEIDILDQKQGPDYLKNLSSYDWAFRSPGVPYNLPQIQKAIKNGVNPHTKRAVTPRTGAARYGVGVKVSSATKLFFDLCKAPIIGVTGTKGKGTTSTLIYKILRASGKKVLLAGNIGKPALEILPKIKKGSIVILELSSFQLQDLKKSPHIAVVTDTFPDHLDAHKNMREYVDAKSNIAKYQKKSDAIFYFKDNPLSSMIAYKSQAETKIGFDGAPFGLKKNYMMASMVAAYLGCPAEVIHRVVKNFKGLEHRLEFVRSIKVHSNIPRNVRMNFYNDSASTNPQTAAAAVCTLGASKGYIILIAGGKDKNLDYSPLAQAIKKSGNVKEVILFGENKLKIKKVISNLQIVIRETENLETAVGVAYKFSKALITSYHLPVTILFSPASASFDMFKDYADRGEQFKRLVRKLK